MINKLLRNLILIGLALPTAVSAISPSGKTVEITVQESDVILVGKVVNLSSFEQNQAIARIEPITWIKGSGEVHFLYRTGIQELDPECCEIGRSYLLFLRRQPDGTFVPVGGKQGVVPVGK